MSKEYKYKCRECPPHIRRRCIQEARTSPAIKKIVARAFESHTDTQDTWDLLQRNCLLLRRDNVVIARPAIEDGGLLSRIRKQRLEDAESEEESPPTVAPPSTVRPRTESPRPVSERPTPEAPKTTPSVGRSARRTLIPAGPTMEQKLRVPTPAERLSSLVPPVAQSSLRYPRVFKPNPPREPIPGGRMLVAEASGHRILLPENGELVLGRFDPLTRVTPDVDLTFEDKWDRKISRRHAKIIAQNGQYELIDLGSRNGTCLNDQRLPLESRPVLEIGDTVRLGDCVLYFDQTPDLWRAPFPVGQYFLYVTFTARFFPLPDKETIIIGRTDPSLGVTPDIDLHDEGNVGYVVSRRHAKLIRRGGSFTVEDLGSANQTRIDGIPIPLGVQMPIIPGQHLWLGGCILALDIVETPDTLG